MKKKIAALLLLVLMLAVSVAGCGDSKTANQTTADSETGKNEEKIVVNVGVQAGSPISVVAKEKGFFEEELAPLNAEVNLIVFANGVEITTAEASGDVDFGSMGDQPALAGIGADYGIKIVALDSTSYTFNQLYAREGSGIESIQDLKGKKVGTTAGTVLEYMLYQYLDYAGLSKDDMEIVNSKDIATLLETGEIDAALSTVINVTDLVNSGKVYSVATGEETGVFLTAWTIAREEFIEENPEITSAVLRAIDKAKEYTKENPDETAEIVSSYVQVSKDSVLAQTEAMNYTDNDRDKATNSLSNVLEYLKENDLVANKELTVDDAVDFQYYDDAGLK